MNAIRSLCALSLALVVAWPAPAGAAEDTRPVHKPPMTAARMKENGSGVAVSYGFDGVPKAGVPLTIVLDFNQLSDPAGAQVRLSADGGLTLLSARDIGLAEGAPASLSVQVLPGAGIGYLHVFTTQSGATSAISVPVQVGKAPASIPSRVQPKQTSAGERILPMPVR